MYIRGTVTLEFVQARRQVSAGVNGELTGREFMPKMTWYLCQSHQGTGELRHGVQYGTINDGFNMQDLGDAV